MKKKPDDPRHAALVRSLDSLPIVAPLSPHSPAQLRRLRLQVRGLYRARAFRWQLMAKIQQELPSLRHIATNPATGTLLVEFHHPISRDKVIEVVRLAVCALIYQKITGIPYPSQGPHERWHEVGEDEALRLLSSDKTSGLSAVEVQGRQQYYGANSLHTSDPSAGTLATILRQFSNLPVMLLLGAGFVSVLSGSLLDGGIILGVVGINAVIGYVTDEKAQRTLRALEHRAHGSVLVLRDSQKISLLPEHLVPGDIFTLRPGLVPADARILSAHDLYVDEALLTGESLPQAKAPRSFMGKNPPLRRRSNMLYMGSEITSGSGLGVVTAIGMATEIGRIKRLAEQHQKPETSMQRDVRIITSEMVWGSLAVCGCIVGIGLLRGLNFADLMRSAVALAIAAVPEGLPAVGTTTLAYGVGKLRANNIYARNLRSIEALGTVQTICWDKTGTITWNRMQVAQLFAGTQEWHRDHDPASRPPLPRRLLEVAALCHSVSIGSETDPQQLVGSGTEKALVNLAQEQGYDISALMQEHPKQRTEQRTSSRHFMRTRHRRGSDESYWTACKGSPLQVLDTCTRWLCRRVHEGVLIESIEKMSPEDRFEFQRQNQQLAQASLRVLGMAYREDSSEDEGFIWLGLVGLKDPPRAGIKSLVEKFHRAGIHLVMVTGDQQETAHAIARDISLSPGDELRGCTGEEWAARSGEFQQTGEHRKIHVFSETTPQQKLEIVKALQDSPQIVAMVGDGINDAPALRASDLGISLMTNAANAAKECADLVVDDREVEDIYHALTYGRTVRHNLRNAIAYLCATNASEILAMLGGHLTGLGAPLLPLQLLWINVMTDIFPSLACALAPPRKDTMTRPPEELGMPLLTSRNKIDLVAQGAVLSGSALLPFAFFQWRFGDIAKSSTAAFCSLSSSQLLYAFSQGTNGAAEASLNPEEEKGYVGWAVLGGMGLLLAGIYVPFLRRSLGTTVLGLKELATLAPVVALSFAANKSLIGRN